MERLLTVAETAEVLGIAVWTCYEWCRTGRLPCIRLGRVVKVDPARLRQWIGDQESSGGTSGRTSPLGEGRRGGPEVHTR